MSCPVLSSSLALSLSPPTYSYSYVLCPPHSDATSTTTTTTSSLTHPTLPTNPDRTSTYFISLRIESSTLYLLSIVATKREGSTYNWNIAIIFGLAGLPRRFSLPFYYFLFFFDRDGPCSFLLRCTGTILYTHAHARTHAYSTSIPPPDTHSRRLSDAISLFDFLVQQGTLN